MNTLPFAGAKTAAPSGHTIDIDAPEPVALPFGDSGRKVQPTTPQAPPPVTTPVAEPVPANAEPEPEPSTFENGGWRPWDDGRDAAGRTFAEWVQACGAVELGKEPASPRDPRYRGLYPPGPRKQPVAEAPDAKRLVLADGKPVVRLDSYARKPSRKTRAKNTTEKGTSYLRAKDIIVLESIVSFGWVTRSQLAALLGLTPNGLVRRLGKLTDLALLDRGTGLDGLAIYSVTRAGRRLIGVESWSTPAQSMLRYDHSQACIEVAAWMMRQYPSATVVTERELQYASYDADGRIGPDGDTGPRLKRVAPWLAAQAGNDYSLWSPRITNAAGQVTGGRKRPDLLLARQGKPPVVVEVELHAKTKPQEYVEMLRAYGEAQANGHIAGVIYFVSDSAALSAKRLNVLLDRARTAARLPASMQPTIEVRAIPSEVWQPLAVRLRSA